MAEDFQDPSTLLPHASGDTGFSSGTDPFGTPQLPTYGWDPGPPVRQRFQHEYRTHLILFGLTLFTTAFVPAFEHLLDAVLMVMAHGPRVLPAVQPLAGFTWPIFLSGLPYALPLLTILGAHEFGHYVYCRRHNVDATLPFFIPAPIGPTGTFGAVIRIREAFPSKVALFDIGVAGPLAGFVMLLPFLWIGIGLSTVIPTHATSDALKLGDPLLVQAAVWLRFGSLGPNQDVLLHPMAFAAWWGMLATALNLMPFGQLDGGHIAYALLGRRASAVSVATILTAVVLTLRSASWISVTLMMLAMAVFLGVRHPRIVDEDTPLDPGRRILAALALLIFIVCFTPVPIDTFIGNGH